MPTSHGPECGIVLLWGKSDNPVLVSTKKFIPVVLFVNCMKFTDKTVGDVAVALTRRASASAAG